MKALLLLFALFCISFSWADSGVWNKKTNFPAEGRHRTVGFSIGNKGYFGLGHYNSGPAGNVTKADIWEYDPSNDSWTQKADYGGGGTYGATAFTIGNKAYVGAHVYGPSEFYEFDPIQNTWSIIAFCPNGSSDLTSFSVGGLGYFIGYSGMSAYDPQNDTWTAKTPPPASGSAWSKAVSDGEKGYFLDAGGGFYEYKPSTDQWAVRAPYPGDAVGGWSMFCVYGKIYALTGYIQFLNPTSRQVWEFDPSQNTWTRKEDFPGNTRRFSSSFSIGNKGYIGTGTNGTNMNDLWEYDLTLGAEEFSVDIVNRIYPIPSNDKITMTFQNINSEMNIEFYSLSGKMIQSTPLTMNSLQLDKQDFGVGTFVYQILEENKVISSGKIIFN
ncbi:MAG: T9SS type A sorting domain-containing protein [Crocinitomicaceae bacterium]|nr:T9SS type A sorting domain-containing protein [Crocinitomicaceae bacterium]